MTHEEQPKDFGVLPAIVLCIIDLKFFYKIVLIFHKKQDYLFALTSLRFEENNQ